MVKRRVVKAEKLLRALVICWSNMQVEEKGDSIRKSAIPQRPDKDKRASRT
jgi:hypothetical protein